MINENQIFKTNETIIQIQAERSQEINTNVVFFSHDKGTARLRFQLRKEMNPYQISEGTEVMICLLFKSQVNDGDGRHIYTAHVEDPLQGLVSMVLEDNILGYVGNVRGSIFIKLPNSQAMDTAGRFNFRIERSPIDDMVPELEELYIHDFTEIQERLRVLRAELEEMESSSGSTNQNLEALRREVSDLENRLLINKKEIENLLSNIQVVQLQEYYHNFENTDEITFTSQEVNKELISILFSSFVDGMAFFHGSLNIEITEDTADGLIELRYRLNNIDVIKPIVKQSVRKGHYNINLYLPMTVTGENYYLFKAYLTSNVAGRIESRNIQATIKGQVLYIQEGDWDGILTATDSYGNLLLEQSPLKIGNHIVTPSRSAQIPTGSKVSDAYGGLGIIGQSLSLSNFNVEARGESEDEV
ncbi:hypothetical protein A5886_001796 [Enterococcus sp. 8G7_MSG3316]|uniref:BppU N-terminal domain-containing protein n=1 Tax=Candidatus Enterococcus testudinis TaxID=1834191 RepID=A0A242A6P9_9ENTE|nr:BppU family phage baseplate upper protein [Enterococcus sp. 8G7_MSG3316]OTN76717.1 hypothetical protein A5886_001796 [Enterococcus sp. 8G7_MSG3316]